MNRKNTSWMVAVLAGILVSVPVRIGWTQTHHKPANVNPTPEQMAELKLVQDTEQKDLEPLMAREKELLKIRDAIVQSKIKAIQGRKTNAKKRAVLSDPEVVAANTDITAVRKTIKDHRANFEARKKDIFAKH